MEQRHTPAGMTASRGWWNKASAPGWRASAGGDAKRTGWVGAEDSAAQSWDPDCWHGVDRSRQLIQASIGRRWPAVIWKWDAGRILIPLAWLVAKTKDAPEGAFKERAKGSGAGDRSQLSVLVEDQADLGTGQPGLRGAAQRVRQQRAHDLSRVLRAADGDEGAYGLGIHVLLILVVAVVEDVVGY